ncbi:5-formyltetrahydrofolate cyclo-ligase [Rhodopseudomonas sp. HC1]|uniref:5-formyltetrahydrofolate cyclo-ligase n=1 Tax=Rhodopseudomonas infernalis TaxID=2897386 RepID=UPI001EE96227|nr:5-formyltetrahydrofolate cyclo-ligase [Rhodopseudomonas infernalis]MCG6207278.1 5-formyltetrahydrofolate cyclo-ligase [Rhodopseudomonas infernalis]
MSALTDAPSKNDLRAAALARRRGLSEAARTAAAMAIAARGLPFELPPGAVVSGYAPIRGELDPLPLMQALAARGARLVLPAVVQQGRPLRFHAWQPGDALLRSPLGIDEPRPEAPELNPDILLIPLAAFDGLGHRIGYGAGYYDCTLEALGAARRIITVGLAFAVQQIAAVPAAAHDVALDYVLTEHETLNFRSR